MARIRNIKPAFFKDADLFDAEIASGLPLRVAYAGLWTVADRAGRFRWKPREIGTDILPYDKVDMDAVLAALQKYGFIFKYKAGGFEYGYIPNFEKHQFINRNEAQSVIPAPSENSNAPTGEEQPQEKDNEYTGGLDTDTDDLTLLPTKVGRSKPPAGDFDQFWRFCPKKVGKGKAKKAYSKAILKTSPATISAGMARYADSRAGQPEEFTAHPATWLNDERWLDEAGGTGPPLRVVVSESVLAEERENLKRLGVTC